MYETNPKDIDFGSSHREVRVTGIQLRFIHCIRLNFDMGGGKGSEIFTFFYLLTHLIEGAIKNR